MFDLNSLIGLEKSKAENILRANGYNDIRLKINSVHNDKTDTLVVCATKKSGDCVTLVCGEFYLNIKG